MVKQYFFDLYSGLLFGGIFSPFKDVPIAIGDFFIQLPPLA